MKNRVRWQAFALYLIFSIILSACLPEGVRLPQSPYLKSLERKSGLVAYISTDENIYTIDQAGNNQHALTSDARVNTLVYSVPIWSPMSRQIAFTQNTLSGGQVKNSAIIVVGPNVDQTKEVFNSDQEFPRFLNWSPDGKQLSFSTTNGRSSLEALRLVDPSGGESVILDIGSILFWSWSPDSRMILLHAGGAIQSEPAAHLTMLDVKVASEKTRWVLPPADFQSPDWSRGKNGIAVAVETGEGKSSLLVADAQGNITKTLTDLDGKVSFAWSPDGTHLAYLVKGPTRDGKVSSRLVVVNPDDLEKTTTVDQQGISAFFWSPDSQRIVYLSSVQSTPSGGTEIASSGEQGLLDLRVLDLSTGTSRSFTTFVPTEQFASFLPDFDQYLHSATIWSPDSQNLVISAYDANGKPGIFIIDGSGSLEPRYLVPGLMAFWSWK